MSPDATAITIFAALALTLCAGVGLGLKLGRGSLPAEARCCFCRKIHTWGHEDFEGWDKEI